MRSIIQRATVLMLYQLSILSGIVLLPVAVAMRRVGVTLPLHRVIDRVGDAYERTATNAA
jgi:hypothetical protein